ncbi:hypothetical protein ACS4Y4_30075, partial [Escherichia coli]|uniref:hypothetical protein n=1 Tax=Escherichia coli TaxID=562 RepID=UPI003F442A71
HIYSYDNFDLNQVCLSNFDFFFLFSTFLFTTFYNLLFFEFQTLIYLFFSINPSLSFFVFKFMKKRERERERKGQKKQKINQL